ncbi:THO complex subunit 6-like [Homarus americanus]|uniref:THO complex subunit 6-like n=1 Tax=Homarus americanus TaxID=6706 RepID=A0A8J5JH96_HOMAM|nr:THO complex subunit 6-like [Homarus americanus]
MVLSALKNLYTTTFSQASSPESAILAVGNNDGKIAVFDLSGVNASRETSVGERLGGPCRIINAHSDAVYSMVSTDAFCISGTTGLVTGRRWDELQQQQSQAAWTISLECDQANFGTPEVNSLAYDPGRGLVYAACGDWRTHVGNLVASSGEDGQVLVWDPRAGREPRHKLAPHTHDQLARPHLGRFISSLDLYNDWLVCGGGPRVGIFHLRSLALTTVLPSAKSAIHATKFTRHAEGGDRGGIVIAGVLPHLCVCSMAGVVTAQLPSSSPCIYTVNVTDKPFTMMTYGGTSTKIDVCFNLNYRDHTVSLLED